MISRKRFVERFFFLIWNNGFLKNDSCKCLPLLVAQDAEKNKHEG